MADKNMRIENPDPLKIVGRGKSVDTMQGIHQANRAGQTGHLDLDALSRLAEHGPSPLTGAEFSHHQRLLIEHHGFPPEYASTVTSSLRDAYERSDDTKKNITEDAIRAMISEAKLPEDELDE